MHPILFILASAFLSAEACPGSKAWGHHAKCEMKVNFPAPCSDVADEMTSRANGKNGWYDPHNKGHYSVLKASDGAMSLKRVTGNKAFTDLMDFSFESTHDGGCAVEACSESQVTSYKDFSTNFCNLHDLYCGTAGGCKVVEHDLVFTESFSSCSEHSASSCLAVLDFAAPANAVNSTRIRQGSTGGEAPTAPATAATNAALTLLQQVANMLTLSAGGDGDCTELYHLSDGVCGDLCLSKMLAPYAVKFGSGLKEGDCKGQGYTVYDHDASISAGPLGKLKVTIYKKPSAVKVAELASTQPNEL